MPLEFPHIPVRHSSSLVFICVCNMITHTTLSWEPPQNNFFFGERGLISVIQNFVELKFLYYVYKICGVLSMTVEMNE
jgi:hypothetical protein